MRPAAVRTRRRRRTPGASCRRSRRWLAAHFPQLEILELLGHGGMGAVYKARQPKLDRLVALKILRPESADDPAFAERFNREARTLARLSHPHIVAVYDFGEVSLSGMPRPGTGPRTLYYFLMEYVDGANLRQLLQTGELTPQQALAIVPQICEALQFAHDEGVVHRDIKPENILLDKRGRVKIADFGLAKLAAGSPEEFTLTGTHQVMGTPRYMAPEQMEGSHAVDHRADIYSLGVVFYEMLTGEVPMGRFEPPSKKVEIDVRLDEVVLRTLAREPERRYQQASDVKTDVESISSTPRPRTGPFPETAADDVQIQAARQLVQFPAMGLIVVGSFLTTAATFVAFTMASWASGRGSQASSDGSQFLLIVPVILALVALPAAIIIGGVKMLRLTDFGWAVVKCAGCVANSVGPRVVLKFAAGHLVAGSAQQTGSEAGICAATQLSTGRASCAWRGCVVQCAGVTQSIAQILMANALCCSYDASADGIAMMSIADNKLKAIRFLGAFNYGR